MKAESGVTEREGESPHEKVEAPMWAEVGRGGEESSEHSSEETLCQSSKAIKDATSGRGDRLSHSQRMEPREDSCF